MSGCRTLVVAQGKSEIVFCKGIASNLKMLLEVDSEDKGETCIQIRQLEERFSSGTYASEHELHKAFGKLEYLDEEVKMPRLRIFPIMDTDDSPQEKKSYRTDNMFKTSVFKDRITPIFNTPNIDAVLTECGFEINPNNKIRSIHKLVNNHELNELINALKDCRNSNLVVFLNYCASITPEYQKKV